MKCLAVIIIWFLSVTLVSQNPFDVKNIDTGLKKNADAVIRSREEVFTVKDLSHSSRYERLVVTVFNEKGADDFSCFQSFYDQFHKLKHIQGVLYDSVGKKLQTLKKSDIKDYSAFDRSYEVTDDRQKEACFNKKAYTYPYTIEFSYTEESSNGMFYPLWYPVAFEHTGIEHSTFSVVMPEGISFRYKEVSMLQKVSVKKEEKSTTYSWSISGVAPLEFEDYKVNGQLPVLITAPNDFRVQDYSGNASSWKEIATFYRTLNADRDQLPEATRQTVKALIENETDELKKIEKLYTYMQSTKRYVSIQLGIGGWQAMKASEVDLKGYGDCKALSNYMIALLKEAGIKAYPVLIIGGQSYYRTQEDFPNFQFNHLIACVPMIKDTLWLECTSQEGAMGYLSNFTSNRKGLVINEDGGALVNTITYTPKDNTQCRKIEVEVNENGNAQVLVKTQYRGIRQDRPSYILNNLSLEKQKEAVAGNFGIARSEISHLSYVSRKLAIPEIEEKVELNITKLIPKNDGPVFITPHLIPSSMYVPLNKMNEQLNTFYLNPGYYNYYTTDTVIYHFSKELITDVLPESVAINSVFGEYTATFNFKDNKLIYCRSLLLKGGFFPAVEYANWISFVKQINKNDKLKVVFKQK